jgi:hypothetical protein
MVAALALVGESRGAEFPSTAGGLTDLVERAIRRVDAGMDDTTLAPLLPDEDLPAAKDEFPDVLVGIGRATGSLELLAVYPPGKYLSAEIRADGTLVEHGFGVLGPTDDQS